MRTPLATTAAVTKTLGHRGRLRILALLRQGQMSVCQMAATLQMPISTLSGLLLELRRAGLVNEERRGKWVFYGLSDEVAMRVLLDVVLGSLAVDPQVRRDVVTAAKLRRKSPAAACAALGMSHERKRKG